MSIECGYCERDLRGEHDEDCKYHSLNVITQLREQRKELLEALKDVIGLAGCQISGPNYDERVARVTKAAAVSAKADGSV